MLEYGAATAEAPALGGTPAGAAPKHHPFFTDTLRAVLRNRLLIALFVLGGAVLGIIASKTFPARYIAGAQIYLDPRGLPGTDKEGANNQDSTGYINLVESQARIVSSQLVLDRVVASEALDTDPEFVPTGLSFFGTPATVPGDATRAAVRALAQRLTVRRPERTFIIDIAVSSRDPAKAARLANAVAHAFIEVQSVLYAQSARQTNTVLIGRLEGLRHQLLEAERQVEEFKAKNGLIGTRDQLVSDQQLRDINQQLTLARVRTEDAKARSEQAQKALRNRGDLGPMTETLNLGTVTALRGRIAEAQKQLADLSADLGPRHPAVKKTEAVLADSRRAMESEMRRVADSFRRDYERAAAAQSGLERGLAEAKNATIANSETSVRLRDLEREADATRTLYESFLNRARRTGEAPDIDGTSTHVVSVAVPPKDRISPPGGLVSMLGGALAGLMLGLGYSWLRGAGWIRSVFVRREPQLSDEPGRSVAPAPSEPVPTAVPLRTFRITPASRFRRRPAGQTASRIDLTRIGLPTLAPSSTLDEFHPILDFLHARGGGTASDGCRSVAILGRNDLHQRTTMALNLALAASLAGEATALLEADRDGNRLTQAIAARREGKAPKAEDAEAPILATANQMLLAQVPQPSAGGNEGTLKRFFGALKTGESQLLDWLVCDGPAERAGPAPAQVFDGIDDILLVITQHEHVRDEVAALKRELGRNASKVSAVIAFDTAILAVRGVVETVQ